MKRNSILVCFVAVSLCWVSGVDAQSVTGPIPVTAESVPFLAADRNLEPMDLRNYGYVEEEFIVSGKANVYDWTADGGITVKTPAASYGTRILVRHPATTARFSGNVVVELLNSVRRFDWAWMWGYAHDHMLENGDAWIGIEMPGGVQGLRKFNPVRYASVSFPNPTPTTPCGTGANATPSDSEEGLRWDMITQVGTLLKSTSASRPMPGFRIEALFLTAGQSPDLMTYINAIHSHAVLENGKPVYDGYLIKQPGNPARINQCSAAPGASDPRRLIRKTDVPVIAVLAQGEVVDALPWRRADSDGASDKFRLYEIAGASHIDGAAYLGLPSLQDQAASGATPQGNAAWPLTSKCEPDIPLTALPVMSYAFNSAVDNLERWARTGTPAPRAPWIELRDGAVALDAYGNGLGGVRSPYVDVPVATYTTTSPGPSTCRELGHKIPFDAARISMLYSSEKVYAEKVSQSVDRLVKERWLTEADGRKIKAGK
jgi:hypothetical protein